MTISIQNKHSYKFRFQQLHTNTTHSANKEHIYEIRPLFRIAVMPIASEDTIKMGLKQICHAILNKTDPVWSGFVSK